MVHLKVNLNLNRNSATMALLETAETRTFASILMSIPLFSLFPLSVELLGFPSCSSVQEQEDGLDGAGKGSKHQRACPRRG